jgi:hypothetical protein
VNTTAWDGDACDGVGGGVAGRDADGGGWDGTACDGVGGGVAGRDADGGDVVPLRLSMAMHTTDEWRSSHMGGEGRGGEGRGGGGGGVGQPYLLNHGASVANKWEGKGNGVTSGPRPPPAATVGVCPGVHMDIG